jgi:hypothetical protein
MYRVSSYLLYALTTIIVLICIYNVKWYKKNYYLHEKPKETFDQHMSTDDEIHTFHNITDQVASINKTFTSLLKSGLNVKTAELLNNVNM